MAFDEVNLSQGDVRAGYSVAKVFNAPLGRYLWRPSAPVLSGLPDRNIRGISTATIAVADGAPFGLDRAAFDRGAITYNATVNAFTLPTAGWYRLVLSHDGLTAPGDRWAVEFWRGGVLQRRVSVGSQGLLAAADNGTPDWTFQALAGNAIEVRKASQLVAGGQITNPQVDIEALQ